VDAVATVPVPANEPVRSYAPGSRERASVEARLKEMAADSIELAQTIGGRSYLGGGERIEIVQPHRHEAVLGTMGSSTNDDVQAAIAAASAAAPGWRELSFGDRAAIFLKAADLLAGPWRDTVNAATMLGQSKTIHQAEIDAACELIDFWRFNVEFGRRVLADQPLSSAGMWNRMDHRPLEGFVMAITPFNFTSIAGNLPTAPALMGNTVIWKPATTQQLSAHYLMRVLEEAGLPAGVINLLTGHGRPVSEVALTSPELAGIHFTGSTAVFQDLWRTVGNNIDRYRSYPRLVGETGGKDFVIAHPSADPAALRTALVRGAFEYQGQKCSAASRAYVPRSIWTGMRDDFLAEVDALRMGDPTDFSNFMGAVIDDRSFDQLAGVLQAAEGDESVDVLVGGKADDREGYFVSPTVLEGRDPAHEIFVREYFGPILSVHVYDDDRYDAVVASAADVSPYALTGSIFAQDRAAIASATETLRFSAGNFYINDKPTGAVVGQQPFGGARASGTNDKAGSILNLLRWVSPRTIKETFVPPTDYRYPFMG
jgi:1-pyrroline-5-carboxylate dehydrogenase